MFLSEERAAFDSTLPVGVLLVSMLCGENILRSCRTMAFRPQRCFVLMVPCWFFFTLSEMHFFFLLSGYGYTSFRFLANLFISGFVSLVLSLVPVAVVGVCYWLCCGGNVKSPPCVVSQPKSSQVLQVFVQQTLSTSYETSKCTCHDCCEWDTGSTQRSGRRWRPPCFSRVVSVFVLDVALMFFFTPLNLQADWPPRRTLHVASVL